MAVGKFLDDATVPTLAITAVDAAADRFLVHDDSDASFPTKQMVASDVLNRLITTTTLAPLSALANYAATAATDSILMFDASANVMKYIAWSEIQNRLLATADISAINNSGGIALTDAANDMLLVWDASSTRFEKLPIGALSTGSNPTATVEWLTTPNTLNTTAHLNYRHSNYGATQAIEFDLPAAVVGLRYQFQRSAEYALRVDPNGSEIIDGGAAGKYLEMQSTGGIELRCFRAAIWSMTTDACIWDWEP